MTHLDTLEIARQNPVVDYLLCILSQPKSRTLGITPISITGMFASGTPDPWEELFRLGEEISRQWHSSQTAVEIISEMRDKESEWAKPIP
jgi:hypothetical protein